MLWCYDEALCKDLDEAFDRSHVKSPCVKVIEDPEKGIDLAAQYQNDEINFPLVALTRHPDTGIDSSRYNFTMAQKGVAAVIDKETNNIYKEKVIPVDLQYDVTVLTTNIIDRDELVKELIFRYTNRYFIAFNLPYEDKRKIRFGVNVNQEGISSKSGSADYIEGGKLYQTIVPITCIGAVMMSYVPYHLHRYKTEVEATVK